MNIRLVLTDRGAVVIVILSNIIVLCQNVKLSGVGPVPFSD